MTQSIPIKVINNTLDYSNKELNIVNFTSSQDIRVRWEEIIEMGKKILNEKYPINEIVWYPGKPTQDTF